MTDMLTQKDHVLQFKIPFTQYHRPNGRQSTVTVDCQGDCARKASELVDKGWEFSCEVLSTGMVALYARGPWQEEEEELLVLSPNDETINDHLADMVNQAYELEGSKDATKEEA